MMNARGLIGSMIGLAAGCGVTGGEADDPSAGFRVDRIEVAGDGLPYFVHGELGQVAAPVDEVARVHEAIAGVLPAIASTLGVPAADLVATRTDRDELGMTHVRLAQQKNGLRVVGGDVVLHLGADGTVRSVNSTARDRALTATPSLAAEDAARLAVTATQDPVAAARSELTYLVSNSDGELYLAWEVDVRGTGGALVNDLVYVDALTGRIVDRHPQVFTVKNRVVRNGNGGAFPVANAPVIGTEATPPTDPVALAAFTNTGVTYDCYKTLYNRDSYNNAGATLTSQVHVVFQTGPTTTSPNNAVWSAQDQMMAYGDGDGVQMRAARVRARRHRARAHARRDLVDREPRLPERVGRAQRGDERHHGRGLRGVERQGGQREHLARRRGHLDARDRRRRAALHGHPDQGRDPRPTTTRSATRARRTTAASTSTRASRTSRSTCCRPAASTRGTRPRSRCRASASRRPARSSSAR